MMSPDFNILDKETLHDLTVEVRASRNNQKAWRHHFLEGGASPDFMERQERKIKALRAVEYALDYLSMVLDSRPGK